LKSAGIQIPASVFFERNAKAVGIKLATFRNVAIDRPKSRNEQNLYSYVRHIAAPPCQYVDHQSFAPRR